LPRILIMTSLILLLWGGRAQAATLREAFEQAGPLNGYDRWVELETGAVYTGGLMIGRVYSPVTERFVMEEEGLDVRIVGNGAILDLRGEQICLSYCGRRLDISDCVITGGGVRFRGDNDPGLDLQPVGSVRHVTFYRAHDYGVRLQGAGTGITLERNLIVDTVDTGLDFVPSTGMPGPNLPTGTAIAMSVQTGSYGWPDVRENWTFFSDPALNGDDLHHFSFL